MADSNTALGVMQSALALAGLLLVFCGFLIAKGSSYQGSTSGDKYMIIARIGLVPLVASLACGWFGISVIQGDTWWGLHLLLAFKITLALTGLYAIIATWLST